MDFINTFGNLQGFDKILNRIKEKTEDPNEITLISYYTTFLAKGGPIFHRQFVDTYFE